MRYVAIVIIMSVLTQSPAFAGDSDWVDVPDSAPTITPTNIVYNNGPVGGGADALLVPQLLLAQKDLENERIKRAAALEELRHAKEDTGTGRTIFWTIVGIAAGAGGAYAITKHK